ncbi:MAG: 3-dehydroquinate dehydratase / shikimate dehydrogenase, partial [Acidobacteriota bacterium]|nr:3-dehydroquinate dehydratase / shikimate dehydrogenase [Acidobacteriota bacterium]
MLTPMDAADATLWVEDRPARLLRPAGMSPLVDLEPRDLDDRRLLRELPPERRVITWRGRAESADELGAILQALSRTPACLYRLELDSPRAGDALFPLQMLRAAGRKDVTAYALGPGGFWTRILAPHLGAPIAIAGDGDSVPSVTQWMEDYGFPQLGTPEQIFGIVGCPVLRSLSPRLHNAAYRALGLEALYLPFPVEGFAGFWQDVVAGLDGLGWPLGGLTVTSPYKEEALATAGEASPLARQAGSANTLLRRNGSWLADTADADGVVKALAHRRVPLAGRKTAVVGCGGAGRV